MRSLLALAAAIATSSALVACIIFTGSTNGYSIPGESEGGTEGGIESGTEASTVQACTSAASCGEDAGLVCCASSALGTGACQPAPCGIQLCSGALECTAGMCVDQDCQGQEVHACGKLPGCTKRGKDAGAESGDASAVGDSAANDSAAD